MLFIARGDGTEVFDLAEEALNFVSVSVEEGAERGDVFPVGHRLNAGPCPASGKFGAQGIGVIGPVREQDLPITDPPQHVCRAAPIMGLSGRDLQDNRQAIGVDKSVDLGRQATS